jgi:hypothetical protein
MAHYNFSFKIFHSSQLNIRLSDSINYDNAKNSKYKKEITPLQGIKFNFNIFLLRVSDV